MQGHVWISCERQKRKKHLDIKITIRYFKIHLFIIERFFIMLFFRNVAVLSSLLFAGTSLHAMDRPQEDQDTRSGFQSRPLPSDPSFIDIQEDISEDQLSAFASHLSQFPNITFVSLQNKSRMPGEVFKTLPITRLELGGCTQFEGIRQLTNLRTLGLNLFASMDVDGLSHLTNLSSLSYGPKPVDNDRTDILQLESVLPKLTSLTKLHCDPSLDYPQNLTILTNLTNLLCWKRGKEWPHPIGISADEPNDFQKKLHEKIAKDN